MKVGFTCGAFDLLHAGHVVMLEEAKDNCDFLMVGLQTDPTLDRSDKNKPVQSIYERYIQLYGLRYVDEVIPYDREACLMDVLTTKKIDVLFHNFKEGAGHSKRIAIPTVDGFVMVDTNDMVRLQSDANYTHIHTISNKKITASKTLKYFEGILDGSNFFRVHKSHLINLSFVEHYLKGKGGYITLTDGAKIEVAVRRKDELLKRLVPDA